MNGRAPDNDDRESPRKVVLVMGGSAERLLFGDVLDHDGFQTTRLDSLSDARARMADTDPGLLLIQLDDQVGAALAFIRWVKSRQAAKRPSVLGITASAEVARGAAAAGADACLQVPVPMAEVLQTVGSILRFDKTGTNA
jgi:DNA-binding response OmpR family regulator